MKIVVAFFFQISLTFVPMAPIDIKLALVKEIAWHRTSDKPLHERILTKYSDAYMRHYGEMS